jgi:hypothetical protein
MHIALTCVESDTFRDWVVYISPTLESYLVSSGDTIRRWIMREFNRQRLKIFPLNTLFHRHRPELEELFKKPANHRYRELRRMA